MKKITLTFTLLVVFSRLAVYGQGVATFQDGVTMLPGGSIYDATIDTEFRAATASDPQGQNEEISVDQFDGGFQTQGAIRFENLLVSQGGLVPDGLSSGQILFAEFRLWKTSPSQGDANIDFNRIVGPDTTSGDFWQEDDTWASLGGDLIPDEFGLLDGDPIMRNDIEAASTPDFQDSPNRFGPSDMVVLDPNQGPVLSSLVYTTDRDSENVFDDAWNGTPEDLPRAIDLSFWRFDVTETVRAWLADTDPDTPGTQSALANFGWAISNDTGDGWDMVASDLMSSPQSEFNGFTPEEFNQFRPGLTIIFDDGSAGPLDIDKNGIVDLADYGLFVDLIGSELDGPLPTGAPGDFDFNRMVDLNDFKFFKQDFPGGPSGLAAALTAAVPEPSAIVLAMGGIICIALKRQQRTA